jgi:hypothetical protein
MMPVKVDARGLETLVKGIEQLQKQIPVAIARGVNEGGDRVRTQVQKALQRQTGVIRYSSVLSRVRTARAFPGQGDVDESTKGSGIGSGMAYQIIVSGKKPTKPVDFKTQITKGPSGGVTVWLWNIAHKFKRSFEGTGKIAGKLRMRTEGPHLPMRGFDGPNMAKEAVKDKSREAFFATADAEVGKAVSKHMAKLF